MPTKSESKKLSAPKKSAPEKKKSAAPKTAVSGKKVSVKQSSVRNVAPAKKRKVNPAQPKLVKEFLQPTTEMISARAHQIWLSEGCPEGRAEEHWLRAEAELRTSV
jgi:hypothetical protein